MVQLYVQQLLFHVSRRENNIISYFFLLLLHSRHDSPLYLDSFAWIDEQSGEKEETIRGDQCCICFGKVRRTGPKL
jgi:hypothetical protein